MKRVCYYVFTSYNHQTVADQHCAMHSDPDEGSPCMPRICMNRKGVEVGMVVMRGSTGPIEQRV